MVKFHENSPTFSPMNHEKTIVISVGGSLIVPDHIDTDFLTRFSCLVREYIESGFRFVIITGGGKTARRYQEAASAVATLTPEDLDWLGLHATRLNGHLLRTIFRDIAHPVIVTNPDDVIDIPPQSPLIIAAGYRPGASTDLRAVQIAERIGAKRVINLSNIDYAYDRDPKKFAEAQPIKETDWGSFRKLLPEKWDPGLSSPFDPVAAAEAERLGLEVSILNGANLDELKHYLAAEPFTGTVIR
jgi:uridylate kinase